VDAQRQNYRSQSFNASIESKKLEDLKMTGRMIPSLAM
jgi:hypothetical protein